MNARTPAATPVQHRLEALRGAMRDAGVDAVIVPSSDPHISEYLPGRWQGREWLSGFTGSVGTLIVTHDFAGLWVDGRYWVQAEAQLAGTGIQMMKIMVGQANGHIDWLAANLPDRARVGVDGTVLGLASARALIDALSPRGIELVADIDLLAPIWPDRPALPAAAVYEHDPAFAPISRADKLAHVRRAMRDAGAQWHLVSTLDDLAWIFNLRGADVNYNPVFVAHALIGLDSATLFIDSRKVGAGVEQSLKRDGVALASYDTLAAALCALPPDGTLLIDPRRVTYGVLAAAPGSMKQITAVNPSTFAKSRKTEAEAQHVRAAMEQDGAALCEFFAWFDRVVNRERITELTIDDEITAARARRPGYTCPSFATIAAFNANGAMPHYRALESSHAVIEGDGLLLIDSGGQYVGGTTDITRVVPVGTPSDAQKRDFTTVLRGTIALSRTTFPRGIKSPLLDAIARAPIWQSGADYTHGTGHGVGYFLNVHEGPQVISYYAAPEAHTAMEAGMITSIEPGIYRPGEWGIRIENLVLNVDAGKTAFGEFLRFETLTLCPIDTRCIERTLMTAEDIAWLNAYHETVRTRLLPHVEGDAKAWLLERTQAI
ncbi:Xaa-Pro aminopeptidase [Pararobbsia alpina]|uniref:aminopeptidase P family protein n=1 Tax=Pararobbsia alpina TaxID=621374 RepID=UPI0039A68525